MGFKTIFGRKRDADGGDNEADRVISASPAPSAKPEGSHIPSSAESSRATSPDDMPPPEPAAVSSLRKSVASPKMRSSSQLPGSGASSLNGVQTPPHLSRQNSSTTVQNGHNARIQVFGDGHHEHHLRNARRQEKLGRMLREVMGTGQKVGNDAVSAVPDFVKAVQTSKALHHSGAVPGAPGQPHPNGLSLMQGLMNRVAKGEVQVGQVNGSSLGPKRQPKGAGSNRKRDRNLEIPEAAPESLVQKYGKCQEVIGRGSYGIVRVSHRNEGGRERLFAVKEFRKRSVENEKTFQDRLMSEFCISSSLHHPNIIETLDLMKDTHGGCCQIMEYCSGGDLYSLVLSSGTGLTSVEADCYFKQILRGVVYMHSMGVAHCDLKPENILLTRDGVCKISDFGNSECFRMAWEDEIHLSTNICGSGPYIAPEEFKGKPFDPRAVDIWALGVIYMAMRTGSYLWRTAVGEQDDNYRQYLTDRKTPKGFAPIEKLTPSKCVYVIYSILDPVPQRRIMGKQVLNSEWGRSIRVCDAAEHGLANVTKTNTASTDPRRSSTPGIQEPVVTPKSAVERVPTHA